MTTAADVIRQAMLMLRVLQVGEQPLAADANDLLEILNRRIDAANVETLTAFGHMTLTLAYTASKNQYTVGQGGNFNGQRPDQLLQAWVHDPTSNPPQDYPPQRIVTEAEWYAIAQKTPGAGAPSTYPTVVWYDPQHPLGVLNVWPMPTGTSYQQQILFRTYLTAFAALSTSFVFPPGYLDWIIKDLAIEGQALFGGSSNLPPWVADPSHPNSAAASKSALKAINQVLAMRPLQMDGPNTRMKGGNAFNILTGGPNPH